MDTAFWNHRKSTCQNCDDQDLKSSLNSWDAVCALDVTCTHPWKYTMNSRRKAQPTKPTLWGVEVFLMSFTAAGCWEKPYETFTWAAYMGTTPLVTTLVLGYSCCWQPSFGSGQWHLSCLLEFIWFNLYNIIRLTINQQSSIDFYSGGGETVAHIAQRGYRCPILGNI